MTATLTALTGFVAWSLFLLVLMELIRCKLVVTRAIPANEFRPATGVVERYHAPGGPGVRMDSHLYEGYEVPPFYDSLLGKLIVWGPDREAAIARSHVALEELVIEGLTTNVTIHQALLGNEAFLEGHMTTNVLDRVGAAAFLAAAARS